MTSFPEGIPIPEQQKTLVNCPLLCTFLRPVDSIGEDFNSWYKEMQKYSGPLKKELVKLKGAEVYSREVIAVQSSFVEQKVIHPQTDPLWLAVSCENLILIGFEIGSVKDVYAVSKRLVSKLIQLNLINPELLTVRKEDDEKIEDTALEPVLAGARFKQRIRKEDPLRMFRKF